MIKRAWHRFRFQITEKSKPSSEQGHLGHPKDDRCNFTLFQ